MEVRFGGNEKGLRYADAIARNVWRSSAVKSEWRQREWERDPCAKLHVRLKDRDYSTRISRRPSFRSNTGICQCVWIGPRARLPRAAGSVIIAADTVRLSGITALGEAKATRASLAGRSLLRGMSVVILPNYKRIS